MKSQASELLQRACAVLETSPSLRTELRVCSLVTTSASAAPELATFSLLDHQIHPPSSLPSVTAHPSAEHLACLSGLLLHCGVGRACVHICTCKYSHACAHTCTRTHSILARLPSACPAPLKLISSSSVVTVLCFSPAHSFMTR